MEVWRDEEPTWIRHGMHWGRGSYNNQHPTQNQHLCTPPNPAPKTHLKPCKCLPRKAGGVWVESGARCPFDEHEIFILIMNKLFIWAPKKAKGRGYNLHCTFSSHLAPIACFIPSKKWGQIEKYPNNTQLPYSQGSQVGRNRLSLEIFMNVLLALFAKRTTL